MSEDKMITATVRPNAEAYSLARAMVNARNRMVEFYDKYEVHNTNLAVKKVLEYENDADLVETLKYADPEQLSWFGINHLSATGHGEKAAILWQVCKDEALDDFDTGHRAANIIDRTASPAKTARFLVIRDAFREDWQPRGATELALVDQFAHMHVMYEKWLACHNMRIEMECFRDYDARERARQEGRWVSPRQSEVEATREAADMAERFQKGFLRTVRALRDLRRYTPKIVIQNAEQVNVANQQVNASAATMTL